MKKELEKLTIGEARKRLDECKEEIKELSELFGKEYSEVSDEQSEFISKYVIVRTYSAGVFAGILESKKGKEVVVSGARRLWYWDGASSLSELSVRGVGKPQNCKFPCEVPEISLTEAIEILPCSKEAEKSIKAVKEWKQNDQ